MDTIHWIVFFELQHLSVQTPWGQCISKSGVGALGGVGVGEVGGYYSLKRLLCNLVTMVYSDIISNTLLLASGLPSCIIVGEFKMLEKKLNLLHLQILRCF